jgi:hypothetical protein
LLVQKEQMLQWMDGEILGNWEDISPHSAMKHSPARLPSPFLLPLPRSQVGLIALLEVKSKRESQMCILKR